MKAFSSLASKVAIAFSVAAISGLAAAPGAHAVGPQDSISINNTTDYALNWKSGDGYLGNTPLLYHVTIEPQTHDGARMLRNNLGRDDTSATFEFTDNKNQVHAFVVRIIHSSARQEVSCEVTNNEDRSFSCSTDKEYVSDSLLLFSEFNLQQNS